MNDTPPFYLIVGENCVWCDKAKALLTEKGMEYISYPYTAHEFIIPLMIEAGLKTVPQIWHRGSRVGGYTELVEYLSNTEE